MSAAAPHFVALDWNGTMVPFFGLPLFAGVVAALERLRAASIPLIVVSHATQGQIEAEVHRVGLSFDQVFGCEDKAEILSSLRAQYGPGVLLGDHPSDCRAASEAGIGFLQAALEGQSLQAGADSLFRAWNEVGDLLLVPSADLS